MLLSITHAPRPSHATHAHATLAKAKSLLDQNQASAIDRQANGAGTCAAHVEFADNVQTVIVDGFAVQTIFLAQPDGLQGIGTQSLYTRKPMAWVLKMRFKVVHQHHT